MVETPLWAHQKEAIDYARSKHAAYLAMGMGTGKSRVVVQLSRDLGWRRVLILCPKNVVPVWPEQYRRFCDEYVHVVPLDEGSILQRVARARTALQDTRYPVVVVANYACLTSEAFQKWALKEQWDALVADEAARTKSPGGKQSRFLSLLAKSIPRKLALSGTPMPHSPLDLYAQYRWLAPQVFGTSVARFKLRYCVMGGFQGREVKSWRDLEGMQRLAGSIMFRVSRDVLDLPEATDVDVPLVLSPRARQVYKELERDLMAELEQGEITAANAMVKLLRLQQVTGGTVKTDDGVAEQVDSGKEDWLADWLEDVDEPVVVFARFRSDLDAVQRAAARASRTSYELSGRRRELDEWKAAGGVLAVQIQAGGEGIDLTAARLCVYYSTGFSLGDYEQSRARLHRPGQRHPVTYYHTIMSNTVDERVSTALRDRKDIVESVLAGMRGDVHEHQYTQGGGES